MYRGAIDAAVFIRHFMFAEKIYFRSLDDALQPFVEQVSDSIKKLVTDSSNFDKKSE